MCRRHWSMVLSKLQGHVYDTSGQRRTQIDASWAPWWRAKTNAIASVLRFTKWQDERAIVKFEVRGDTIAMMLEGSET